MQIRPFNGTFCVGKGTQLLRPAALLVAYFIGQVQGVGRIIEHVTTAIDCPCGGKAVRSEAGNVHCGQECNCTFTPEESAYLVESAQLQRRLALAATDLLEGYGLYGPWQQISVYTALETLPDTAAVVSLQAFTGLRYRVQIEEYDPHSGKVSRISFDPSSIDL